MTTLNDEHKSYLVSLELTVPPPKLAAELRAFGLRVFGKPFSREELIDLYGPVKAESEDQTEREV